MAYQLRADETVPAALKRIVQDETTSACNLLKQAEVQKRDEVIHEARKSVKKIRGVLRLVESELGDSYCQQTRELKQAGSKLAELRDAAAMTEIFDAVVARYKTELRDDAMNGVRQALLKRKTELEQSVEADSVMTEMASVFGDIGTQAKAWPLETDGFGAIESGFSKAYRRGRKAFAVALDSRKSQDRHDWRKRVKDHWYHVRLLENLSSSELQAREANLKQLETYLGDDHNLVLLRQTLEKDPDSFGGKSQIELLLMMIIAYQRELQQKAIALGKTLYDEKPGQLIGEIAAQWQAWRGEPAPLKKRQKKQEAEAKNNSTAA